MFTQTQSVRAGLEGGLFGGIANWPYDEMNRVSTKATTLRCHAPSPLLLMVRKSR